MFFWRKKAKKEVKEGEMGDANKQKKDRDPLNDTQAIEMGLVEAESQEESARILVDELIAEIKKSADACVKKMAATKRK